MQGLRMIPLPEPGLLNHRQFAVLLGLSALAFTPFAVAHAIVWAPALLAVTASAAVLLVVLMVWVFRRGAIALPALLLVAGMGSALLASMSLQSTNAIFWAFPLVLVTYLIFALRPAIIANGVLLVALAMVAINNLPLELWSRFLVTLTMVSVFTGVFSYAAHGGMATLDRLTQVDPLTGVWNRRHLNMRLAEPRNWLERDGIVTSFVMLDIDHFKAINDRVGHAAADGILTHLAGVLSERVRDSDLVFRYGGEEFTLMLPNTGERSALVLAEQLRLRVEAMRFDARVTVTISAGVAELQPRESAAGCLDRADAALLAAKAAGRNRVLAASDLAQASTDAPDDAIDNRHR